MERERFLSVVAEEKLKAKIAGSVEAETVKKRKLRLQKELEDSCRAC